MSGTVKAGSSVLWLICFCMLPDMALGAGNSGCCRSIPGWPYACHRAVPRRGRYIYNFVNKNYRALNTERIRRQGHQEDHFTLYWVIRSCRQSVFLASRTRLLWGWGMRSASRVPVRLPSGAERWKM